MPVVAPVFWLVSPLGVVAVLSVLAGVLFVLVELDVLMCQVCLPCCCRYFPHML